MNSASSQSAAKLGQGTRDGFRNGLPFSSPTFYPIHTRPEGSNQKKWKPIILKNVHSFDFNAHTFS